MSELVIRPAGSDDYPSFAVLFPELRVNDPVPSVPRFCAEIAPSAIIAERDGCVLGYAFFQLIGETGYIRNYAWVFAIGVVILVGYFAIF